jgi:PAS domain S-box-containing protein
MANSNHFRISGEHLPAEVEQLLTQLAVENESLRSQLEGLVEANHVLESSRQEYVEMFDLAPIPYLRLDQAGTIRGLNHAAAQLLGVEVLSALDYVLVMFVTPEDRGRFREHLRRCRQRDETILTELTLKNRTGRLIPVELVSRVSPDTFSGGIVYRTSMIDLTERRAAEKKIRQLNEELEERVAQRTARLEESNRELHAEMDRRSRAEQELRTSEARFRGVVESEMFAICFGTFDG